MLYARASGMSWDGAGINTTTTPSTASATAPGPRGTGRGAIRVDAAPWAERRATGQGRGRLTSCPGRVPKGDGWELRSGDRSASSPPHHVCTTATVSGHRGTGRGGFGAVRHGDPGAPPIGPRGPRSMRLGLPGHTVSAVLHSRQRAGSAHSRMTMRIGQFWSHLRGRAGSGLFAD